MLRRTGRDAVPSEKSSGDDAWMRLTSSKTPRRCRRSELSASARLLASSASTTAVCCSISVETGRVSSRLRRRARSRCALAELTAVQADSCPASRRSSRWKSSSSRKNSSTSPLASAAAGSRRISRSPARPAASTHHVLQGRAFDGLPDELRLGYPPQVHQGDERPDLREDLDQPFFPQQDEAFAHRRPADAQFLGQLVFGQRLTRRELQGNDATPERFQGLVPHGQPRLTVPFRVSRLPWIQSIYR